jgi:hypothetical protein
VNACDCLKIFLGGRAASGTSGGSNHRAALCALARIAVERNGTSTWQSERQIVVSQNGNKSYGQRPLSCSSSAGENPLHEFRENAAERYVADRHYRTLLAARQSTWTLRDQTSPKPAAILRRCTGFQG